MCNKQFYVFPSKVKAGEGKYCSRKCVYQWRSKYCIGEKAYRWKGGKIKRACIVCNKTFYKIPSKIKKYGGRFCSNECKNKYLVGKNHNHWQGGKRKRICQHCNKIFYTYQNQIRRGYGRFCRKSCFSIWNMKNQKKEDTDIELIMEAELKRQYITYSKQVPIIGIALVDFLLSNKIIIQCDGEFWHSKPEVIIRDIKQNKNLKASGYKVYRFNGIEIKNSVQKCLDKIKELKNGHK